MTTADRAPRDAPDFRYGGRLSLDLTWTVRYRAVQPTELLRSPADLARWLTGAGLPSPTAPTAANLDDARTLREAVHRSASALLDGHRVAPADRAAINRFAAEPTPAVALGADGERHVVVSADRRVPAALSVVARDAIDLLAAHDGRLRRCEGPRCSLLFHDASRPGTRRWCDTAGCGNKVNTVAYRRRAQQTSS